jgi:hypothetical protein
LSSIALAEPEYPAEAVQPRGTRRVVTLLLLVLTITAFPSNYLFYLAPVMMLAWPLVGERMVSHTRLFGVAVALLGLTFLSLTSNLLSGKTNNYAGLLFAGMTWASTLILVCNRGDRWRVSDGQSRTIVSVLSGFVILQAITVALQATQTRNWDALAGTYGMFDFRGRITISQVMFTFNLFVINLYLLPYWRRLVVKVAVVAGFVAVAAAQSGHQTAFFILTLFMIYGSIGAVRAWPKLLLGALSLAAVVLVLFPSTPSMAMVWAERLLFQEYPKALVVLRSLELLGEWHVAALGTGVAQFSSRAALFSSGGYLGVALPQALTGQSSYFVEYMLPLLDLQDRLGEGSAIAKPYFSILTLAVEFGLIVFVAGAIWVLRELVRARKSFRAESREVRGLARFRAGFLLFLVMCGMIENYFEFVQAITLPVLLYLLAEARIQARLDQASRRPRAADPLHPASDPAPFAGVP